MARRKPKDSLILKTFSDADQALKEIGEIDQAISIAKYNAEEQIREIKDDLDQQVTPKQERRKHLEAALRTFAEENKHKFNEIRSRALRFGVIGFRTATGTFKTLTGVKWKDVLEILKDRRKQKFIKIKRTVDKKRLIEDYRDGKLTDQEAHELGIYWAKPDEMFYETFEEENPEPEEV